MKKVLLLAPHFNNYTEIFSSSIQQCGYQVIALSFEAYSWKTALCKMLHQNYKWIVEKEKDRFNRTVTKVYEKNLPDFVIVIRGDFMREQTLRIMKKSAIALWLYDSISRYPESGNNWDLYDLHYVFEESDVEKLSKEGKEACFLPLGYDSQRYYAIESREETIDISFVGAMYESRKKILEQLVEDFPDLNMKFYGIYVFKRNVTEYIRFLKSPLRKVFKNRTISHSKANQLYSKSKINLNILHEQSKGGWNARLNEILGAGGFQIVSYNPKIEEKYHGMLETFQDYSDLKKKIKYYLERPQERKDYKDRGYQYAGENETYKDRFEYILRRLEEVKK